MKTIIYNLSIISLIVLQSCMCNFSQNYKTLDLIFKNPDSLDIYIKTEKILIDPSLIDYWNKDKNRMKSKIDYYKKYFFMGYKIIDEKCSKIEDLGIINHKIYVKSLSDSSHINNFIFNKKDGVWFFYGSASLDGDSIY